MMPKVSIIVPVYNAELFLMQCLESIVAQTFNDWECILVNDGSSDGSPAICDEFAARDCRFSVIHQENGGPGKARNVGLDVAQGEWISFIDADDWIDQGYFNSLLNCNDNVDIITFGMTIQKENGDSVTLRLSEKLYRKGDLAEAIFKLKSPNDLVGIPWNKFLKSSIIKENNIKFPEDIAFFEDQVYALRFYQNAKSVLISNESPYNYRILQTGLTRGYERTAFEYSRITEYYIQETFFLASTRVLQVYYKDIIIFYFKAISVSDFKEAVKYCMAMRNFLKDVPTNLFPTLGRRRSLCATLLKKIPYLSSFIVALLRRYC